MPNINPNFHVVQIALRYIFFQKWNSK